jgi:hypothetical protein
MSKQINTRIQYKYDSETNWYSTNFISLKGEFYVFAPDENHDYTRLKIGDGVHTVPELPFVEVGTVQSEAGLITVFTPTAKTDITYTGQVILVEQAVNDFNTDALQASGTTQATDAGTYTATFTLRSGYCWEDGTTENRTVTWEIKRATPTFLISPESTESLELYTVDDYKQISVLTDSPASFSVVPLNVSIISTEVINVSGVHRLVNVTPLAVGTTKIELYLSPTRNYFEAKKYIPVTVKEPVLEEFTWDQISEIAKAGLATRYFSVGDIKKITTTKNWVMNGSTALPAGDYYVYILGFNHGNSVNTIDFQMFKSSQSQKYLCMTDNRYDTFETLSEEQAHYSGQGLTPVYEYTHDDNEGHFYYDGFFRQLYNRALVGTDKNDNTKLFSVLPDDLTNVMITLPCEGCSLLAQRAYDGSQWSSSIATWENHGTGYKLVIPSLFNMYHTWEFSHIGNTYDGATIAPPFTLVSMDNSYVYDFYSATNTKIKYDVVDTLNTKTYWTADTYEEYRYNVTPEYTRSYLHTYGMFVYGKNAIWTMASCNYHYGVCPIFRVGGTT